MLVKAVGAGKWTITLGAPFKGETEWDLDGYVVNITGAKLREVARDLGVKPTSRMLVADIRKAVRAALINLATTQAFDAMQAVASAWVGTGEANTVPVEARPTIEDAKWNLFYRATSLGYDKGAAMEVADCFNNWDGVSDPCPEHPNHSMTLRRGYLADGCEACEVIKLSDDAGFNQADEMERLRRLEEPTPAERAEDALKIYAGADITVDGVRGVIKSVGSGEVTIETFAGPGMDYTKSYPCQPILSRILGGVIRIMRDGRFDCVCALVMEAGAPNLPQGGFACRGCGSVFVKQDTEASADVLATSRAVIERKQAASYAAWVARVAEDANVEIIGGHPYSKNSKSPIFRNVATPSPRRAVELSDTVPTARNEAGLDVFAEAMAEAEADETPDVLADLGFKVVTDESEIKAKVDARTFRMAKGFLKQYNAWRDMGFRDGSRRAMALGWGYDFAVCLGLPAPTNEEAARVLRGVAERFIDDYAKSDK